MSFLGWNALCTVFLFISLSSFHFHFENGPEYLTRGTAQVFTLLMRFLLQSLISGSFLVLLSYFIIIIIICSLLSVFHTSVSWWLLTGVWMTSLLKSPRLFSVLWPISIMLLFEWYPFVLLFPSPNVLVLILWWLYQKHQLQFVLSSLSCPAAFSNP